MLEYKIKDLTSFSDNKILDQGNMDLDDMKFIIFEYLIPRPIFPPVKRISKIYCLNKSENVGNLGLKYSLFNFLTCWVGMPFAPIMMILSFKKNRKGIDITDEIRPKITIQDIQNGFVKLPIHEAEFSELDKSILQAIKRGFKQIQPELNIEPNLRVGYVKLKGKHIFIIGISSLKTIDQDLVTNSLTKEFSNSTEFILTDLKEENDLTNKLKNEGKELNLT